MKKFILLLSAILLITSVSFAQKNVRAGKLQVKKDATFKSNVTFQDPVIFESDVSIISTITFLENPASGTFGNTMVLLTGLTEAHIPYIIIPQNITLFNGSCDGAVVTITEAAWMSGAIALGVDGTTPCTDYDSISYMAATTSTIRVQDDASLWGSLTINDRYSYIASYAVNGPLSAYGTMLDQISGNYVSSLSLATHIAYPYHSQIGNLFYSIDSIRFVEGSTCIYANSLPAGMSASLNSATFFTFISSDGNLSVKNKLLIGDSPIDSDFSVHGDGRISGHFYTNHINNSDTNIYSYSASWISSDSILIPDEYGDISAKFDPGDIIEKSDASWSREIATVTYGDYSYIVLGTGMSTLITYNGADVGSGAASVKVFHYPDVEFGGGATFNLDAGVYLKTFRGSTDPDITGWIMTNANGTVCYVYPNAAGDGITVSTTKP